MGKAIVDPIADAFGSLAVDWQEVDECPEATADNPYGEPAYATVRIRLPHESSAEVTIAEVVWSDRFKRPPCWMRWLLTLGYLIRSLPAVLMLIGPDRRDHAFWLDDPSPKKRPFLSALCSGLNLWRYLASPDFRHFMRVGWRLLTLALLLSALVGLGAEYPWLSVGISLIVFVLLATRINVADHVITAAARDVERNRLLDYLESRLRWLEQRCESVVIIAHSQGGYLAHQLLTRDGGRNQEGVRRFVGVGSGLKPISILGQTRRPAVMVVSWLLPAASLCLTWGILPLTSDAPMMSRIMKALAGATMLMAMPVAALASERGTMQFNGVVDSLRPHSVDDFLPFDVTGMEGWRWALIGAGVLILLCCVPAVRRITKPAERSFLELPQGSRGKLDWQEHSSQHDVVGRMLLPVLPEGVEQEATPVLGHPLRDHTLYFAPDSILVRHLAGDLLADLQEATRQNFRAEEWQEKVACYSQALRKQHDRRRMFHGLLTLAVTFVVLIPRLALGASLPGAVLHAWLPLGVAAIILSYLFTRRGHKSLREAVAALDTELRGESSHKPLLAVLPPDRRLVTAVALTLGSFLAATGALWLTYIQQFLPQWQLSHPGAGLIGGVVLVVLAAATASGYRVKRRWALGAAVLTLLPPITSRVPHSPGLPTWAAAPGLASSATVVLLVSVAVIALTRAVPVALPARRNDDMGRG
ncbi:lipase family protein [Streptomyces celluloflavus]|uniref:hypothetical protein n=1 Tax=Streptomyces celluloflavus TaxID=58344 RepID=UPI00367D0043